MGFVTQPLHMQLELGYIPEFCPIHRHVNSGAYGRPIRPIIIFPAHRTLVTT